MLMNIIGNRTKISFTSNVNKLQGLKVDGKLKIGLQFLYMHAIYQMSAFLVINWIKKMLKQTDDRVK